MAVTGNGRIPPAVMPGNINIPWATLLTWGVLLIVVYTLHELFFIIFVTFLLAYMVRSLVTGVAGRIRPGTESPALERWLTLAVFAILLLLVWGVFSVLGSRFIDQSRTLLVQAQRVQAEDMLDSLLSRTVGTYLFQRTYGDPGDPRYQSALAGFQAQGRQGEGAAMSFARLRAELQSGFELDYEQAERQRLHSELRQSGTAGEHILTTADEWQRFTASPQYQAAFERYYEQRRRADPAAIPYDYPTYLALSAARTQGKQAFSKAFREYTVAQPEQSRTHLQRDFEDALRGQLARQWWNSNPAAVSLRASLRQDAATLVQAVSGRFEAAMQGFLAVPAQLLTALLLTVFITLDFAGLKRGVTRLRTSRLRGVYDEVVPGLVIFARLVGRSFSAQALVALFNTLFTFILLSSLGVHNELLLCGIVFFASFIPVLGVIIAGIPITLQAILQPGGSVELALFTIAGILLIHLIETTLLSPRILGKVLHLHPVLVIVIIVIGEHFFGLWGLLLGVPVAVFVMNVVVLNEAIPGIYDNSSLSPADSPRSE